MCRFDTNRFLFYNTLMALAMILAALLLCFLIFRHHVGIPFLAMIAGVTVYDAFGASFAEAIHTWIPAIDTWIAQQVLYGLFVAIIPIVLYFRVGRSGLFGILRIIESAIFALMLTILLSGLAATIFSYDSMTVKLADWINGIKGILMVGGVIFAYVDVFFYRSGQSF